MRFEAKNGVLTLKGTVDSQGNQRRVEQLAASIPNVNQVVNETQVRGRKATTTP